MDDALRTLAELERSAIEQAMDHHRGYRVGAAKSLGISVRTLQRKLKERGWQTRWPVRYAVGPKDVSQQCHCN
jgi:DNA-binding NtrC family response regulator